MNWCVNPSGETHDGSVRDRFTLGLDRYNLTEFFIHSLRGKALSLSAAAMQTDHHLHSVLLFVFQFLLSPLSFLYPSVMFVVNQLHFLRLAAAA